MKNADEAPSAESLFARIGGRPVIAKLLRHFYADVRQHQEIGPVFNAKIQDWPSHLEKIADFWSGVTGGPPRYSGPMPRKHLSLGIGEKHFAAWLELWRRHCRIHLPPREAGEMIQIAEALGERLQAMIAYAPPSERGTAGPAV